MLALLQMRDLTVGKRQYEVSESKKNVRVLHLCYPLPQMRDQIKLK